MGCCRKRLYDKSFTGWGLHIDFYELLVALAHTPAECRQLIKEIEKDKRLSDGYEASYRLKFFHKLIEILASALVSHYIRKQGYTETKHGKSSNDACSSQICVIVRPFKLFIKLIA